MASLRGRAGHLEINARLVRLLSFRRIPVHLQSVNIGTFHGSHLRQWKTYLDGTRPTLHALISQIRWHLDREVLPRRLHWLAGHGILVPARQVRSNDTVAREIDDRDIGRARVRCDNLEIHVHLLARRVFVHVGCIVCVLEPFTLPEVALGSLVVALGGSKLFKALNVVVDVTIEVVVCLFAACGFVRGARVPRSWRLEVAMGVCEAEAARKEGANKGGLHGGHGGDRRGGL